MKKNLTTPRHPKHISCDFDYHIMQAELLINWNSHMQPRFIGVWKAIKTCLARREYLHGYCWGIAKPRKWHNYCESEKTQHCDDLANTLNYIKKKDNIESAKE